MTNADLVALLKRLGKADEVNLRDWREIQDLLTALRAGAVVLVPGERTYEAGWEARRKRDEEICRARSKDNIKPHLTDAYKCALAIARDGKEKP